MNCSKSILFALVLLSLSTCFFNCSNSVEPKVITPKITHVNVDAIFPFQNISNWWKYTEKGGNFLTISVVDAISDDSDVYYKVKFEENNKDTTTDWFLRTVDGVYYNEKLAGGYKLFLPSSFTENISGVDSNSESTEFSYSDSLKLGTTVFDSIVKIRYATPILHGFNEVSLANGIGIVSMTDNSGRFVVEYILDSASIDSQIMRY